MRPVPRLLPAVIVVGLALLGLKGEGLVRSAWAQEQNASAGADVLAKDTAPVANDVASDDSRMESAAEVDVLSSLAKRRAALDARESDLQMRSQVLSAAEARVDQKIATLRQLQEQIQTLLGQRDEAEKAQFASLVKTYSAMKPKDAARIFNNLSDEVLVPVAQAMKADVLAPILANMNSENAQKLTLRLANRLKTPDTAAAALQQAAALVPGATPAPQPVAPAPQPVAPTPVIAPPQTTPIAQPEKPVAAPQRPKPRAARPKPTQASAAPANPSVAGQATTPAPVAAPASPAQAAPTQAGATATTPAQAGASTPAQPVTPSATPAAPQTAPKAAK